MRYAVFLVLIQVIHLKQKKMLQLAVAGGDS